MHHPIRWRLYLLLFIGGASLILLQSCRQNETTTGETAVPIVSSPTYPSGNDGLTIAAATPLPVPATSIPLATSTAPFPTPTPPPHLQEDGQLTIGQSVQGRPIIAHWSGTGSMKVVLVGGGETAEAWAADFPDGPAWLTTWFVPDFNPDNVNPTSPINANGINLALNADSRFSYCPNQQQTPAASGPYPFSEPESQALRDFLADAWVVIWLTDETENIVVGGCGQQDISNRLVSELKDRVGEFAIDESPVTGHFIDYLAGEGTASAMINLNKINKDIIVDLLLEFDTIAVADSIAAEATIGLIDPLDPYSFISSKRWQFPTGTFVHPIAVETLGSYIYVLDSGQVQQLDRRNPTMPEIILAPDAEVSGVRVIEPIDIAADGSTLFVLDRAGDVYAYDTAVNTWSLHRYDRPVGETSTHYYVALAAQADQQLLLESSYHFALTQSAGMPDFIWPLPEYHQIDMAVNENHAYILSQSPYSQTASLVAYENGARDTNFSPGVTLHRPRQIDTFDSILYVLDQAGRRLWHIDALTGKPYSLDKPADGLAWAAFDINQLSGQMILASKDSLTFVGELNDFGENAVIQGTGSNNSHQIYDPAVLESMRGLLMPIGGSDIALRENQMPGAPRHYRLGIHEGADFYWQAGTPVRAVAAGTVIRANVEYQIPTQEMFASWGFRVEQLGFTSAEAHDFYRGMQVWIEHEGGLVSRYVHLSAIDNAIREGVMVEAGQIIGAVGNTGSPVSLESPNTDAHLHFELWLNNHYLGQFLRPIETREWLAIILNEQ